MDKDWRRLTRAAYVVAGHLDAASAEHPPGLEAEQRRGRSRRARRPPRLTLSPAAARVFGIALVLLVGVLLLRACAAPTATDLPVRASTVQVEGAASAGEPPGETAGDGPPAGGAGSADPPSGSGGGGDDAAPSAPSTVVVHVAGAVATPGLVSLPAGSRVGDAVGAAGGALPGAQVDALNLARVVVDGEQVRVSAEGEDVAPAEPAGAAPPPGTVPAGPAAPAAPGGGSASPPGAAGGLVDLNAATQAELETLPGIGPALAQRILEHRATIGGFTDVAELDDVSGIGPAIMERLRPLVSVGR